MDVYAVLAYRWGNLNEFGYLVGVYDDEEVAIAAAETTYSQRGGKYECEVLSVPKNKVHDGFDVPLVVLSPEQPRPVHREPDPLRDKVDKRVIEVRVTRLPDAWNVSLIFSDGTTSAYLKEFPTADAADQFAAGMREAISWQSAMRA